MFQSGFHKSHCLIQIFSLNDSSGLLIQISNLDRSIQIAQSRLLKRHCLTRIVQFTLFNSDCQCTVQSGFLFHAVQVKISQILP